MILVYPPTWSKKKKKKKNSLKDISYLIVIAQKSSDSLKHKSVC